MEVGSGSDPDRISYSSFLQSLKDVQDNDLEIGSGNRGLTPTLFPDPISINSIKEGWENSREIRSGPDPDPVSRT